MANVLLVAIVAILIGFGVPARAADLSTSIMRPSLVDPAIGAVSGNLPGAGGVKIYYLALDLSAGSLMTQLEVAGRPNGERRLELQLLDAESRPAEQAFVRSGFGPKDEVTRSFAIDTSGRYVIRVSVEGEENGRFCILFGGTALPTANAQNCSATTAAPVAARPTVAAAPAVPAPAPAPHPVVEPAAPDPVAPAPAEPGPSSVASKLSTSMLRPTPLESLDGVILGNLPGGAAARTYYVSADVEAGGLLSQLEISGRANGERRLTLELLGPDGRAVESAFVRSGFGTKDERTKAFVIDSAHRAVLRLIAEGEENGEFCLLVGGGALPSLMPHSCPTSAGPAASTIPDEYSTSILQPSAADSGLTAGKLPGGAAVKYYYLSADLTAGSLMTQLQITGRPHGERRLTLELLGPDARVAESTFVRAGFGAKDESTKTFAIDASGRRLMRLIVEGDAPGNFCLLMGGTALPGGAVQDCPANAAAAIPPLPSVTAPPMTVIATPAAPPKNFEVIVTKCEERLRVKSDFLFDFDRADIFPEADSALRELANRSDLARRRISIEGYTDGKGTDSYNQRLSERRADAVRAALIHHGMFPDDLIVHGFGKSHPIAPNQNSDGSDNPEGRLKNRRVDLVVNTCG